MKKTTNYTAYLELGIMIVLLGGLLFITSDMPFVKNLKPETGPEKVVMFIGIILISMVVLAVHELGHLVTGLIQGFRFELFVVGPLGIKREDNKIKLYLNTNLGYYGGVAATSPVDDHQDNAKKFARILLAGPLTSLLFAALCIFLAYWVGKPLGIIFYTGSMVSIGVFLATTIPSQTGMFFTDRKRYQRLVTPGKEQAVELAMLKIMGQYARDNSYKNVDQNDINTLIADDLPFIKFFGLFNLICFQLQNNGASETATVHEYESLAKEMSGSLVAAFAREIKKLEDNLRSETVLVTCQ